MNINFIDEEDQRTAYILCNDITDVLNKSGVNVSIQFGALNDLILLMIKQLMEDETLSKDEALVFAKCLAENMKKRIMDYAAPG